MSRVDETNQGRSHSSSGRPAAKNMFKKCLLILHYCSDFINGRKCVISYTIWMKFLLHFCKEEIWFVVSVMYCDVSWLVDLSIMRVVTVIHLNLSFFKTESSTEGILIHWLFIISISNLHPQQCPLKRNKKTPPSLLFYTFIQIHRSCVRLDGELKIGSWRGLMTEFVFFAQYTKPYMHKETIDSSWHKLSKYSIATVPDF